MRRASNMRKFRLGKAIIYATLEPELFCELFRTIDGQRAIQLLTLQIFGFATPDLVGYVAAGLLAGLDYGSHIIRIDPTNDALDIMGLTHDDIQPAQLNNAGLEEEYVSTSANELPNKKWGTDDENDALSDRYKDLPLPEEKALPRPLSRKPSCPSVGIIVAKIASGILTEAFIVNYSMMNAIAIYHIGTYFSAQGKISEDAARMLFYTLGGATVATEITCNNFLVLKDAVNSVEAWADFKNQPIYNVFKQNPKAGIMAASKAFVTHTYHGAIHYLLTKQVFWGVFPFAFGWNISYDTTEYIGYSSAVAAFLTFTLQRTNGVFESYRRPFVLSHQFGNRARYDYDKINQEDRRRIWRELNIPEKIKMMLQPTALGLIRASSVGYIVYTFFESFLADKISGVLPEAVSALVATIPSVILLAHAMITEREHALNKKFHENEMAELEEAQSETFSTGTQLSTLLFNVGKQSIHGLIGLYAIHQMLGTAMGDRLATVLGLGIASEVALTEGLFFQAKMPQRVAERGEEVKVGLTKLGGLLCTRRRAGYEEIGDPAVNDDLQPEDGCCRKRCGF